MHVHWNYGDIMHMEHAERRNWVRQVAHLVNNEGGQ
jgi:hypothetical protein